MRPTSNHPISALNLRPAHTRWLAYRRAYSGSWQGFIMPRWRRGLYQHAASHLASMSPPNAKILDVGAGPGHLLAILARELPDATLLGVDINRHMTDEARRLIESAGLKDRIAIQQADAAALPFEAAAFDYVVSMMSYHLWDDRPGGLAEIHRVLKPQGALHLYVGRTQAYPGRLPELDYFNHRSREALEAALCSAGLETVAVRYPRRLGTYLFASATS